MFCSPRCILAASSPVLASVLSSTGALVELQAPCLSGSVLALLLDYIYTGALPCTCTQQQYYNLLTAAHHLQMEKLQEALCAWQDTKINTSPGNEDQAYGNIISSHRKPADIFNKYQPATSPFDAWGHPGETEACSEQVTARLMERSKEGTYAETQVHSSGTDQSIKPAETNTRGASSTTAANRCSGKDVSTLGNANTCSMSKSSGKADNCRQATNLTLQNLTQNTSSTTEGYGVSRVDKDTQRDRFLSAGTIKPETWQNTADEEIVRTDEDTRSSSSPSSSLPHPCCGAVPVICHSGRAAVLQPAQASTKPAYHAVCQASVNSSRARPSRSASTENKNHPVLGNLDYIKNKDHNRTEALDSPDSSVQCASQDLCYKSTKDQADTLKHKSICSYTDHFVEPDHEHMEITDHNDHCDSFQKKYHKKQHGDDLFSKNKDCSSSIGGLNSKTNRDDLSTEHQRPDWSVFHDVSMSAEVEERSDDVSLPVNGSDKRSDSYCEDLCLKTEVEEKHVYTSKRLAELDRDHQHCNINGPEAEWNPRLHSADQHEHDSSNRDTAPEDRRHSSGVCLPLSKTSLDNVLGGQSAFECNTHFETSQQHFTPIPGGSNTSEPMHNVVGHSYYGHVHYHCIAQEDVLLSYGDSDHKQSYPGYPEHSDQSSGVEAIFASRSPLRQHFATETTEQFLLLDISTKHAELLVSYKDRAGQENKGIELDKNNTSETEIWDNDRDERNEATSGDKRKIRARAKVRNTSRSREADVDGRKSVGREQSRSRAEVKNKAGVMEEVSKHGEGENKTSTLRVCSAPSVPEPAQPFESSTFSVCIPSTLPDRMSTNISARLSTPLHQAFQCSLCDRSFSQRGSLNRHVRSHLGVRPFPCPRCPMTFSRQYRVTEHMRVHQRCTLANDFLQPPASSV